MATIFISYRREDKSWLYLLAPKLREIFGQSVFWDNQIQTGREIREEIRKEISACKVFLPLIGPGWVSRLADLDNPDDYVSWEIKKAFDQHDVVVLPVVIGGAKLPAQEQLPQALKKLPEIKAILISAEEGVFESEMTSLIERLRELLARRNQRAEDLNRAKSAPSQRKALQIALPTLFLLFLLATLLWVLWPQPEPGRLKVDPETFDFGSIAVGEASQPKTFVVVNVGGQQIPVDKARSTSSSFKIDSDTCSDRQLTPRSKCQVVVSFAPDASAAARGQLLLSYSEQQSVVGLAGKGIEPVSEPQKATRVVVPDVHNLERFDAEQLIRNADLSVGDLTFKESSETMGSVLAQSPSPGESVTPGTPVDLEISLGRLVPVSTGFLQKFNERTALEILANAIGWPPGEGVLKIATFPSRQRLLQIPQRLPIHEPEPEFRCSFPPTLDAVDTLLLRSTAVFVRPGQNGGASAYLKDIQIPVRLNSEWTLYDKADILDRQFKELDLIFVPRFVPILEGRNGSDLANAKCYRVEYVNTIPLRVFESLELPAATDPLVEERRDLEGEACLEDWIGHLMDLPRVREMAEDATLLGDTFEECVWGYSINSAGQYSLLERSVEFWQRLEEKLGAPRK